MPQLPKAQLNELTAANPASTLLGLWRKSRHQFVYVTGASGKWIVNDFIRGYHPDFLLNRPHSSMPEDREAMRLRIDTNHSDKHSDERPSTKATLDPFAAFAAMAAVFENVGVVVVD